MAESFEDINFGDLGDIFDEPLLDDLERYGELNPAFRFWESDQLDPRIEREFKDIFYNSQNKEREEREVTRRLQLFRIAIRAKIEQLMGNEVWGRKGGSSERDFRAAPRTFLKTAQEVLSGETERMVFTRDEIAEPEAEANAIEGIIIDPRRISNTLLHNLGLAEFIPQKGLRQEEQLKRRAEAIPKIREMLMGLEPIELPMQDREDLNYFRLMRIGKGPNTGYIIGTQNIEGRKRLFKTDLYGAERRLLHIEESYREEIRKLKWIELTLKDVRDRLQDWLSLKGTEQLEIMKQSLIKCAESLEFVRDADKRDLLRRIRQIMEFKDSTGRYNPGAVSANLTVGLRHISSRYQRIERIWKHVGQDKGRINQMIAEEEKPMGSFLGEVELLHDRFKILRTGRPIAPAERERIMRNLNDREAEAKKCRFEPNLSFGVKFVERTNIVKTALSENRNEDAGKEFVKMYLIAKLAMVNSKLQDIYKRLSLNPITLNPEELWKELQKTHEALRRHLVAAQIRTPEYDKAFGDVYHLFNSLKKRLNELLESPAETRSSPSIRETVSSTLNSIIAHAKAKVPILKPIIDRIAARMPAFLRPTDFEAERARMRQSYTLDAKLKTFGVMKERIGDFDFSALIKGLN